MENGKRIRMKHSAMLIILLITGIAQLNAQSKFIIIDQFGYLPDAEKIAVIKDPQTGFDADESFSPGAIYHVIEVSSGDPVFTGVVSAWKSGTTDASSGDKAWHFDFSDVVDPGTYYILDEERGQRSYEFRIAYNIYNEVLRQAMRTFFYQRVGFEKSAEYAGEGWADGASHVKDLQDLNCRHFLGQNDPDTERDVSGGWYDAGDYNKYTNWTANYIVEFMKAYIEAPDAWGDDYNIPESGNGIPDILDEAMWGIDHLMRMQLNDGSVLSIVGEAHGSPPSSAAGPSKYGDVNTSATNNTAAALAISSTVYRSIGMTVYADTLLKRAKMAWDWADANPNVLFQNNDGAYNSQGLGAGRQEVDNYGREMIKLEAACFLFEATGEAKYKDHFDSNYTKYKAWSWGPYQWEHNNQDALLYYTSLAEGSTAVQDDIKDWFRNGVINGSENLAAHRNSRDPYMAYMKDYTWGSNSSKAVMASMIYDIITHELDGDYYDEAYQASLKYVNYINGVNPLAFVYLSNMYDYGAENGVNEFYHSWFKNGSEKWDRVGTSTYGPPPGYLTGGPNPNYNWDGCCPSGCGSSGNNSLCTAESINPPTGQPAQKSYKDFNTSWPLNSWEVTENSCGYQTKYVRMLSKFVTTGMDCNGEVGGDAFFDSCGVCAGGNTGINPTLDPSVCEPETDCNGDDGGVAYIDSCGICAGGNTDRIPVLTEDDCYDCNDDFNGEAYIDACDRCAGGNTGIIPEDDPENCDTYAGPGSLDEGFRIYPNPAGDILNISIDSGVLHALKILDLNGKIVLECLPGKDDQLDISMLEAGFYDIMVILEDQILHKKFMKL